MTIGRIFGELVFLVIVLTIVAFIVSKQSKASTVITSAGKFLSSLIAIVVTPVKGT